MSTLKVDTLDSSTGTTITVPTSRVLTITDAGGISMAGTAITATGAELNILDGVTSTTAELNILDGVTSTAAELNILDGVTASAAELNYVDVGTAGIAQASKAVTMNANSEANFYDKILQKPYLKDIAEIVNAIGGTGGGAQSIDLSIANVVSATVDTSTNTFTFDNPSPTGKSCSFLLILTNGGSQTVTWPGTVDWVAATAPTLTTSGTDVLVFTTVDAGVSIWYGFVAGLDVS